MSSKKINVDLRVTVDEVTYTFGMEADKLKFDEIIEYAIDLMEQVKDSLLNGNPYSGTRKT